MTDIRVDCLLGYEIRMARMATGETLLSMSDALGWQVSKLSCYECRVGALTDDNDARAIEDYCRDKGYPLSANAKVLSGKEKIVDIAKIKATIATWRENINKRKPNDC